MDNGLSKHFSWKLPRTLELSLEACTFSATVYVTVLLTTPSRPNLVRLLVTGETPDTLQLQD